MREQTCLSILDNDIILRVNSEGNFCVLAKKLATETLKVTLVLGEIQIMSTVAESVMSPACICMGFLGKQISNEKYLHAFYTRDRSPMKKKNTQDISHPVLL